MHFQLANYKMCPRILVANVAAGLENISSPHIIRLSCFRPPLKIQTPLRYCVANKKLLLTYHPYAAPQFFARALSRLGF